MKATRIATTLCLVIAPALALARPQFVGTLTSTYGANAGKNGCATCHVGMNTSQFNPFGKDLKAALAAAKAKAPTAAILHKLDAKDSDKDGVKNGAELKKGTNPGDPKSK